MDENKKQMSESFLIGSLLAIVGGYLDAYTYIARGHVFANAQTGNMVLLGINIANGDFVKGFFYLIPIGAFLAGVYVCEIIKTKYKIASNIHWRQFIVFIEIISLLIVFFIPNGALDTLVNIIVSFVCAMQVEAFRKLHGAPFATTMCTGNLRSGTEKLYMYIKNKDIKDKRKFIEYFSIIFIFILGSILGALITPIFTVRSILVPIVILIAVFFIMFFDEEIL